MSNKIKDLSFEFALQGIEVYKYLIQEKKEFIISKQILKSSTSVGAMVRESEHAESKMDFIHKLSVAFKEANESIYWLELLKQSQFIDELRFDKIKSLNNDVLFMLIAIIKTSKQNLNGVKK